MTRQRTIYALACICFVPLLSVAEDRVWTGAVDNQFLNEANWDGGLPNSDEDVFVVDGGQNQPVIIADSAETITTGGFQLGSSGETGGHVVQNGGTMVVSPFPVDGLDTAYEYKSHIGDKGSLNSSWIMNNNAVMLYDAPLDGDGSGLGTDGENGFDLEIGAATGEAVGRLELHDNAIIRISDDLKIGAEENGNGQVVMDGNSVATIGSGISVGENAVGKGMLQVGGSALLVSGNSAGPGMADIGRTNEGYLTLTNADVEIFDSANVYIRTLQHRAGVANITIGGGGQLHVFEAFEFAAPDLGNATVIDSGSGRTSHVGGQVGGEVNLTIKDDGIMSIDSDLESSAWSGFAVSGGNNSGGNADGGISFIEVRDRGSFTVQQDLHLTLGTGEAAESTLKVVGPDANVSVNGNLYLALDIDGLENPGSATLHSVITGGSQGTITVAGDAEIANGRLSVELDGYSPRGGESYTLLEAGKVNGDAFLETDFSLAALPEGLDWDLSIDETSIILSISGMLEGILGDFDSSNGLDLNDIDALVTQVATGSGDLTFDVNSDGSVSGDDIQAWLSLKSEADGKTYLGGDTDLDGAVVFADFLVLSGNFGDESATWSQGNFDGLNGTAFADFLTLSGNFGSGVAGAESVPEPSSGYLLAFAMLAALGLRRR